LNDDERILKQQIEYYRARATEYDEWFLREGRYFRGEDHRRKWLAEVDALRRSLVECGPRGRILEIACGTGLWTQYLVEHADSLLAIDSSSEAIQICRDRVGEEKAAFEVVDIFNWNTGEKFDFIFFGFWLSHVPAQRFEPFWNLLSRVLAPDGDVVFFDSLMTQESTAKDHASLDNSGRSKRKLNDGREFEIVKVFYIPEVLQEDLRRLGWNGAVSSTGEFFLHGSVRRA